MSGISIGSFQVRLIRAGTYYWDGGAFFGVVPKTLWAAHVAPDEQNRIPAGLNCYLIETDEHKILIDTGGGNRLDERAMKRMKIEQPLKSAAEYVEDAGVDPESIDIVVNTHLHWDHASGNTVGTPGEVRAALPRARYLAQLGEWEHAHTRHPRDSVSYLDINYDPLVESGQMQLVDNGFTIAPGITMRKAAGHNRDMCIIEARSEGAVFCQFADLVPLAAHVTPTWVTAFDLFPVETVDTKFEVLADAAREQWWCGFGHEAAFSFARIKKSGDRYQIHEQIS